LGILEYLHWRLIGQRRDKQERRVAAQKHGDWLAGLPIAVLTDPQESRDIVMSSQFIPVYMYPQTTGAIIRGEIGILYEANKITRICIGRRVSCLY
jgi:hypothetical protein